MELRAAVEGAMRLPSCNLPRSGVIIKGMNMMAQKKERNVCCDSGGKVKIECYISQGCGSEDTLKQNIDRALHAEKIQAQVDVHRISDEKAAGMKLGGSPSVFINGKELQPSGAVGFS